MDILYLNSGNVNLLENFRVPASIIVNSSHCFSNSITAKTGDCDSADLLNVLAARKPGSSEFSIKLRDKEIMAEIIHHDDMTYIAASIKYNDMPGYIILSGSGNCAVRLPDFISRINNSRGIKKILLVDDDPAIIETYRSILNLLGYETDQHTCPQTALACIKNQGYDLLISDYDMPAMNGLELTGNFYRSCPGTPVIIISGSARFPAGIFRSELRDCMVSFMSKPVTINDLTRSLEVMEFFYKLQSTGCRD